MKTLDTIDDRVNMLVQIANKNAGYEKVKYTGQMTAQNLIDIINLLKEEFNNDPKTLKELYYLNFTLEGIVKKNNKEVQSEM